MSNPFTKIFKNQKGFRKEKKLTNAQRERQEQAQAFSDDYKAICAKHKLQLRPIIRHEQDGSTIPDLVLTEYQPPQLKDWGEAQKENLEVQKKCRHLNENNENCKTCGVRIADQDPSGTGVTVDFIKIKEQKIADYEAKKAEHDKEEETQ